MSIKDQLQSFTEKDIYTTVLFLLYKLGDDKQYSTLSQLSYIMDKEQLFKFCEFFGGLTIKVPTKTELINVITALTLYTKVDINGEKYDEVIDELRKEVKPSSFEPVYQTIKEIMKDYTFTK